MKKIEFRALMKRLGGKYESAKIVADFRQRLTPDWFEHYVKDFFASEKLGFQTMVNGWYHDKGVDVWGRKILEDGTVHYLVVQCKRWGREWIHKKHVAEFWGDVEKNRSKGKITFFFITTTELTGEAKKFCNQRGILASDTVVLLEMHEIMNLYDWMERIKERYCETKFRQFVNPEYLESIRMKSVGFEREKLNVRLDAAVQTALFQNEMQENLKEQWNSLFAKGIQETYLAIGGETVERNVDGSQVVYV